MSHPTGESNIERRLPDTSRDLNSGLQLFREASGPILEVFQQLAGLKEEYPYLEVRGLPENVDKRNSSLKVYQISSREVSLQQKVGHLPLRPVLRAMLEEIPSLSEELPVDGAWVNTHTDGSNATFVNLIPNALDLLKLARERHKGLRIIEGLAGTGQLRWGRSFFDLTVAYIPPHAAAGTVEDTVNFLESRDLAMTLLPADF